MDMRTLLIMMAGLAASPLAVADLAKHTTITTDANGKVTEYKEMVADDNGNMRIEMYGVDTAGNRGALKDMVVFQAGERRMLATSGGRCEAIDFDSDELPGGIDREEMVKAQAEMQAALAEMRAKNPEMAKMMEAQMGNMNALMGGQQSEIQVMETGQQQKIDGYDTTAFRISGLPGATVNSVVWAVDIDDVDGANTIAAASTKMMQANRQMMEKMGMGEMFGANLFGEIMGKMRDYYPIVTEQGNTRTRLISTDGKGSDDFYPACN